MEGSIEDLPHALAATAAVQETVRRRRPAAFLGRADEPRTAADHVLPSTEEVDRFLHRLAR